jgi:hypothetical protein
MPERFRSRIGAASLLVRDDSNENDLATLRACSMDGADHPNRIIQFWLAVRAR